MSSSDCPHPHPQQIFWNWLLVPLAFFVAMPNMCIFPDNVIFSFAHFWTLYKPDLIMHPSAAISFHLMLLVRLFCAHVYRCGLSIFTSVQCPLCECTSLHPPILLLLGFWVLAIRGYGWQCCCEHLSTPIPSHKYRHFSKLYIALAFARKQCVCIFKHSSCYGLNCAPPHPYFEALTPNGIILGGGAFGYN